MSCESCTRRVRLSQFLKIYKSFRIAISVLENTGGELIKADAAEERVVNVPISSAPFFCNTQRAPQVLILVINYSQLLIKP